MRSNYFVSKVIIQYGLATIHFTNGFSEACSPDDFVFVVEPRHSARKVRVRFLITGDEIGDIIPNVTL